jgi:poly-gamma-glutamate biosynthesis protein PgsC/CapC
VIIEAFVIGLVLGFLYYELTGISPGGVVPPAYLALFMGQPQKIVVTMGIALVVWLALEAASRHLIVYGRRRLLFAILLGCCLKLGIEYWIRPVIPVALNLESIGYVIPGLIANEMARQKAIPTVASIGVVTVMTYLALLLLYGPF